MLISTKQKHNSLESRSEALELKIRDNELEVVQTTKYLGPQIDCSLDWKQQIKAVCMEVSRAIGFLRHATPFLPLASLKTLYTGIVELHFRYCCSVWGCAGSTDISQLQRLQNRAARIITNSSCDTLADHLLWSWAGRPLKNSLVMSLKQWSSSRSMIWLHNTCVTCSPKTLLAPPATSGTLRLI